MPMGSASLSHKLTPMPSTPDDGMQERKRLVWEERCRSADIWLTLKTWIS